MAGQAPNSSNIERVAGGVANATSIVVHPEFQYWRWDWRKLRDVLAGQREVKRKKEIYLKRLPGQNDGGYESYLEGATFYNMTSMTLNGMLGQVFQRDPIVLNLPDKFKDIIRLRFGKDGSGHLGVSKTTIAEQIGLGRYGILVDAPATPSNEPTAYVVGYAAENILDWTVEDVNGTYQLTRVLLREFVRDQYTGPTVQNPWINASSATARGRKKPNTASVAIAGTVRPAAYIEAYTYTTIYRELLLERQEDGSFTYIQNVYSDDPTGPALQTFVPTVRGTPLSFIPFKFFGATSNQADVEKSPLLDIADLNISHYRTSAALEWGRAFTALPVYYAPGKEGEGAAEYHIGPSMVWEVPPDSTPGILEYKGEGLKALERGLEEKQNQIAAIGGRMLPGANTKAESPDQTASRQSSEQALLLNVIQACEAGFSEVIRWWLMWQDVPLSQTENVIYKINRSFVATGIGARELRAFQMMYDDGIVRVEDLYNYLMKADALDPDVTQEEFVAGLEDPDSFPNRPDMAARSRGYATRQQELEQQNVAREADMQQQEIDLQDREVTLMENAPPPLPPKPPMPSAAALPPRASGPVAVRPGRKLSKKV